MKRKLKTWKAFKAEFKPIADKWDEFSHIYILYKTMNWTINNSMKKRFGTEIEVKKINDRSYYSYTHEGNNWCWHELWFEPEFEEIEFITKEEIEI